MLEKNRVQEANERYLEALNSAKEKLGKPEVFEALKEKRLEYLISTGCCDPIGIYDASWKEVKKEKIEELKDNFSFTDISYLRSWEIKKICSEITDAEIVAIRVCREEIAAIQAVGDFNSSLLENFGDTTD